MKPQYWSIDGLLQGAGICLMLMACSPHQPPSNGAAPLATQPEPTSPSDLPVKRDPSSIPPPETPTCGGKVCAVGTECIEYYGIAGKMGGAMYSCEVRCKTDAQCPTSVPKCVTIADGPGRVCR